MAFAPLSIATRSNAGTGSENQRPRNHAKKLMVCIACICSVVTLLADVVTGTSIGSGNTVTFSFDPVGIPGGPPPAWGRECGLFIIGATSGSALWYQTLDTPSSKGFKFALDFMLGRTAMADGTFFSFAVSKAAGASPPMTAGTPLNWREYVKRFGNLYKLMFVVGEGESETVWYYPEFGTIQPLVVYRPVVTYDILHQQVRWEVDGIQIGAMTMSPNHLQTVQHQVIGSSGSSTARYTTFLVDRVEWEEVQ